MSVRRKPVYDTLTSITGTLTSLADDGWYECASIDNSSNLYDDAQVMGRTQVGTVTGGTIEIFAYGGDGTIFTAGLSGANAALTWGTTQNTGLIGFNDLVALGVANVDDSDDNDDVEWGPFFIAGVFGGRMPKQWGIVIHNKTGGTTHVTGTNNYQKYMGIWDDFI